MATNYEAADGTVKQLLDFGEALKMMKFGCKVRRQKWQHVPRAAGRYVAARWNGAVGAMYMYEDNVELFLYVPSMESIFAEDWEVLPRAVPEHVYRLE